MTQVPVQLNMFSVETLYGLYDMKRIIPDENSVLFEKRELPHVSYSRWAKNFIYPPTVVSFVEECISDERNFFKWKENVAKWHI